MRKHRKPPRRLAGELLESRYLLSAVGFVARDIVEPSDANGPESVHAADLDGDGDVDVLSAIRGDNKIVWFENTDGAGTFGPMQVISIEADLASSVYAADVDGDGDVDVLSASTGDDKIAWYENTDGAGTFGPQQVISATARRVHWIFAVDVDGDEDVDVLSASWRDGVAWYENTDGNGSFGPPQVISTLFTNPHSVHASDVDGDGDVDVLAGHLGDENIAWYENTDGNGAFGRRQLIDGSSHLMYMADLDGDGDGDVISTSTLDDKITWYENRGGRRRFGPQQVIATEVDSPWLVYATDVDGDGDADVLSAGGYQQEIAWYENTNGAGTFGPQQLITSLVVTARSVSAADLDGDGDVDVLSASTGDDKIAWYENADGAGTFGEQKTLTSPSLALGAWSVYAVDINGDGDVDVLSASRNDHKIAWYENTDVAGTFGPQQVITSEADFANSVFATDFDGDGDIDVLSGSESMIAWYENTDGLGTFGQQRLISTEANRYYRSAYASDVDGDGDMDVLSVVQGRDLDAVFWFENIDGEGAFGRQQMITSRLDGPQSIYAVDLDGDGDVDVLSASRDDNKIAWYENSNGRGIFGRQQVITVLADLATTVFAADLDGDGDVDVLSASTGDDKIAWYENTDGAGTFGPQQVITRLADAWPQWPISRVYVEDVDGDGDIDVLSASAADNKIAWYENTDGVGTFGPQQVITTEADFATSVFAEDLDGDGDVDVLSSSGDKITWYENEPKPVVVGDTNGDLRFDQLDIVQVLQAAKYLTGRDATFEEGDWNGDGVFDQHDIVAALQTGSYLEGPHASEASDTPIAKRSRVFQDHPAAVDQLLEFV